jgi:hypothetical protein
MSASYKGAIDPNTAALIQWLQEPHIFTHAHCGVITPMMSAIDSPNSALHVSCGPRVLRSLPAHKLEVWHIPIMMALNGSPS